MTRVPGVDYGVLDQLLGYSLRRAQVALYLAFHAATRGRHVTPPRFTALVVVGANPGISQSTLGAVLGIARSGAMLLTNWMVGRGLVERRRHADDGRAWGLQLTRRGTQALDGMKAAVLAEDRRRAARLSAAERRELLRLLEKLAG